MNNALLCVIEWFKSNTLILGNCTHSVQHTWKSSLFLFFTSSFLCFMFTFIKIGILGNKHVQHIHEMWTFVAMNYYIMHQLLKTGKHVIREPTPFTVLTLSKVLQTSVPEFLFLPGNVSEDIGEYSVMVFSKSTFVNSNQDLFKLLIVPDICLNF